MQAPTSVFFSSVGDWCVEFNDLSHFYSRQREISASGEHLISSRHRHQNRTGNSCFLHAYLSSPTVEEVYTWKRLNKSPSPNLHTNPGPLPLAKERTWRTLRDCPQSSKVNACHCLIKSLINAVSFVHRHLHRFPPQTLQPLCCWSRHCSCNPLCQSWMQPGPLAGLKSGLGR